MVAEGKPCPLCESPLAFRKLPQFSGDESPLSVTLVDMPALACDKPHTYFVRTDFPLWLMGQLQGAEAEKLPAGKARGLLFKEYTCGECGGKLARRQDHRHEFRLELAFEDYPGFVVRTSVPLYRCGGCGREQIRSLDEVRSLTPAALAHAFKEAGLKPPG